MIAGDEFSLMAMPHDVEAEQAVIGSMLIDETCIPPVVEVLKPDDFFLGSNRNIFSTIWTMFSIGKPIDGLTVAEEMRKTGVYDENTTRPYLAQLMEITPTSANAIEYAHIVKKSAVLRGIVIATREGLEAAEEYSANPEEVLSQLEKRIYDIRQGQGQSDLSSIGEVLPYVLDEISALSESGRTIPGTATGISTIDRLTLGLNNSDLVIIAGRPGMGKTAFATTIAVNVAKSTGKTVAFFSLEMSKEQLTTRILSAAAMVKSENLRTGRLNEQDWENIAHATTELYNANVKIDDKALMTVGEMLAKTRRQQNLGLVVIDYLQLVTAASKAGSENRQQAISEITRTLKIMAKDLNVPVICLSQLSRASEKRDNKRPQLSDLRDSGAIEQDADVVLFLYRDDYYNDDPDKANIAECIVAKNRHGETGTVELSWLPEYTMFCALDKMH